jgi:uncharacterized membrane protein
MSDPNQAPQGQPVAAPTLPKEVEEGRTFAILSYALSLIGLPFFLVPLIMRNNEFSLYHSKQCLLLWLGGVVVSVVGVPLMAVCIGFILVPAAGIFLLVLDIMGLVNAIKGEQKPVPLVGKYADEWFKGLKKV